MSTSATNKLQLRMQLRMRRRALSAAEQTDVAVRVVEHLGSIPGWGDARRIALYQPSDGELDPANIEQLCRSLHVELYLPVVGATQCLEFAAWASDGTLQLNRYGIAEPPADAPRCAASDLDIIFMPLVGWSADGARLGMGGGYYDRTLARVSGPLLVGLAHEFQQLSVVPQEPWDIRMNYVLTVNALHRCGGLAIDAL